MKCLICGESAFECIHKGTRDVFGILVLRCKNCKQVCLDSHEYNRVQNYKEGGMLKDTYSSFGGSFLDMTWENWVLETKQDDIRRYNCLKDICTGKHVLEFGCGNGGFLRRIANEADSVVGIELMEEARKNLLEEKLEVFESLEELKGQYDVICMFMVLEHLNHPDEVLKDLNGALKQGGLLICETPNANDALISKFQCEEFEKFTYWSEHVFLYNSNTLEKLMTRNQFNAKCNTQLQRYSLANHLYWLAKGKPGGHTKWLEFNERNLNDVYGNLLIEMECADTLWYIGQKQ